MDKEKKSILVVDDERSLLSSLKDILQREGYEVDIVEKGEEAIKKSKVKYYNLALIDIRLPDMEGTELLTKMHKDTPRMMKIIITGFPSLGNALDALNQGADAYLLKPIKPERLLKVVEEKLREQEEAENMTQEKIEKWIETRVRRLEQEHRPE